MSEFAGYPPERLAHDLELMKQPDYWPNNPFFLKRWTGGNVGTMEHGTLYYKSGWYTFRDDFGLEKTGGKELCDELVLAGWVAD